MKSAIYSLSICLIILLAGCDENPVQPSNSITQKINHARPFETITITFTFGNGDLDSVNYGTNDFSSAVAKNGFFIVYHGDGKSYYNLSTAKGINIQLSPHNKHNITITY